MLSKSEQIREQAKRADELAKKLSAEGGLFPSEGAKTSRFTNSIPDFQAEISEPAVPVAEVNIPSETPKEANPTSTEVSPTSEVSGEELFIPEKQYKSAVKAMNDAQRKAAEAEKLLRQQADEHERFKLELQQIKSKMQSDFEMSQHSSSIIDESVKDYEDELPDTVAIAKRAAQAAKQELNELFSKKLSSVEEEIKRQKEEAEMFKFMEQIRLRDERVKSVHPDYDDIRLSDEFKTWVYSDAPSLYRAVYEGTVNFDDRDATKIMDDYKSYKGTLQKNNTSSRPKVGAAELAVKTPSAVISEMGNNTETEFTADDISKLPYMIHRIKDPAQRKALMERADKFMSKQLSQNK
jgi:hypothetical protein